MGIRERDAWRQVAIQFRSGRNLLIFNPDAPCWRYRCGERPNRDETWPTRRIIPPTELVMDNAL